MTNIIILKNRKGDTLNINIDSNLEFRSLFYIKENLVKKVFNIKNFKEYIKKLVPYVDFFESNTFESSIYSNRLASLDEGNTFIKNEPIQLDRIKRNTFIKNEPIQLDSIKRNTSFIISYHGLLKMIFISKQYTKFDLFVNEFNYNYDIYFDQYKINDPHNESSLVYKLYESNIHSCIYMIELGLYSDLKDKLGFSIDDLPDDFVIIKIGQTLSNSDREKCHSRNFWKILNIDIKFDTYININPLFLLYSEQSILKILEEDGIPVKIKNAKEIYAVSNHTLNLLKQRYEVIKTDCDNKYSDFKKNIYEFENIRINHKIKANCNYKS